MQKKLGKNDFRDAGAIDYHSKLDNNKDKTLENLIARTQTRETSTLTIVTVSSSASLIFLGLFSQNQLQPSWVIAILGILFPIISLFYREVTYRTIQEDDYNEIRNRLPQEDYKIIRNEHGKKWRQLFFYILAFLPIFWWFLILAEIVSL